MTQAPNPPYGNIFYVQTPSIDRTVAQLQAEQKQREFLRQKQAAALDEEFAKNVANIRDADVDDVTKKYGEWKLANQQLMKQKGGVSPQQQLDLLRKKAEIYKVINASKLGLKEEEDLREGLMRKPDDFDDNAATFLAVRRKTPLTGLAQYKDDKGNPVNLADYNTYRYKGTDTDFSKIDREAAGTPKQVYQEEAPMDGGLQVKITPYMYGSTPLQYYQSYLGSLGKHRAGRDAEALASQIKPEVYTAVQEEYKAIPADTWKRMGVDKPQELVIDAGDSKADRLAKHQAQLYALNNQPKQGTPVFRNNLSAIDAQNFEQQKEMQRMRDKAAERRLGIAQTYKKSLIDYRNSGTKKGQEQVLEDWIQRSYDEGELTNIPVRIKGSFVPVKKIAVPMDMKKKYTLTSGTGQDKVTEVPRFVMTRDKKFVVPMYPDKPSDYQEPIPIETFRNELGKLWLSAKDRVGEMDEISFDNEDGEEGVTETVSGPSGGGSVSVETIDKNKVPKGASVTKDAQGNIYYQGKKINL
jgi:peptidoglycan hydrolase-like protein with peptidoglycan-binding domain